MNYLRMRGIPWGPVRKRKYGNVEREFQGRIYHSKKEALYAQELELLKKAGKIKEWKPQFKLSLDVNDKHITNYYVDFKVLMPDGSEELHEVKGFATELWRFKWKLCEALYSNRYHLKIIT